MSSSFREALDHYIYFGGSSIEALERAGERLDEAFADAVRSVVEKPVAEAEAHG